MITDIPKETDFHKTSARFLGSAWSDAVRWIERENWLQEQREELGDTTPQEDEDMLSASTERLAVAHITAYTGIEHMLRARITSVSPFLLICGSSPQDWPKGCERKNVPFADFRTVDAQDLTRICNAVLPTRIPDEFVSKYESLRRQRNALIHSHSTRPELAARELLETILYTTHTIVGPLTWTAWRRQMLIAQDSGDESFSWNSSYNRELRLVIETLGAKEVRVYMGINKRARLYYCPKCLANCLRVERKSGYYQDGVAQLETNNRTLLVCRACDSKVVVERKRCTVHECKGDVIYADDREEEPRCMTCANYQD